MSTVEEIEQAISKLPPNELDRFRAWFEAFEAARFDEKIERDATWFWIGSHADYDSLIKG